MYKIHVKRPVFVNRGTVRQTGTATAPPDLPALSCRDTAGAPREPRCFPSDMGHCVVLHFGQGTSSCLVDLLESQGHKSHQVPKLFIFVQSGHWKAFWHWLLLSFSAGLQWEVALYSPHPGQLDIFFMPKSPQALAPGHRQESGKEAWDIANAIQVGFGEAWFCQKRRAQIPLERQEGSMPSQHPSNIPAVPGAFLPPSSSGSSCPKQWRGPHLHTVIVRKDQTFPRGEATTCCHPSCSHWLQQERAMLRSTGVQAMVLLPTTAACAASRRCRRCRAKFCTNLG